MANKALSAVKQKQITIVPDRFEKEFNHWLTNIHDWCISRQLWWGHQIPVYHIGAAVIINITDIAKLLQWDRRSILWLGPTRMRSRKLGTQHTLADM